MSPKPTPAGMVLVSVAIATSLLLGSLGWFAVGFGTMTACTNDYSCSPTGCAPCATTGRWINAGGLTQWVLVGAGVAALLRRRLRERPGTLATAGVALLATSVLVFAGSTWAAQQSYCRPGTPGHDRSYCSVGSPAAFQAR